MEIVAKIVKYHSSLDRINQSTAMIVFKIINRKTEEVQVAEDLAAEVAMAAEVALAAEAALTEDHEKCTKQPVETVVMNAKFHLSQNRTSLYTARIVSRNTKEIKKSLYYDSKFY